MRTIHTDTWFALLVVLWCSFLVARGFNAHCGFCIGLNYVIAGAGLAQDRIAEIWQASVYPRLQATQTAPMLWVPRASRCLHPPVCVDVPKR
jgi:hypothetical protein